MDIQYQQATESDIDGFLSLYEATFIPEKANSDWFEWQYVDLSELDDDNPSVVVAINDEMVVGAVGFIGSRFRGPRGESIMGIQPVNVMVHPDYRGQGIFNEIVRTARNLIYPSDNWLEFGYPNEIALKIWTSKHQWEMVRDDPIPRHIRLQYPTRYATSSMRSDLVKTALSVGNLPVRVFLAVNDRMNNLEIGDGFEVIKQDSPPIGVLTDLYQQAIPNQIHLNRTSDFYETRLSGPHSNYVTYVAQREDEPMAAIIVAQPYHASVVHVIEALPITRRTTITKAALRASLVAVIGDNPGASGIEWSPALPSEYASEFSFTSSTTVRKFTNRYLPDALASKIPTVGPRNFCVRTSENDNYNFDILNHKLWHESGIEQDF